MIQDTLLFTLIDRFRTPCWSCVVLCAAQKDALLYAGYQYAADYWSLGVLIYFLLHEELPPQQENQVDLSVLQVSPKLSLAAVDLLRQLLQPIASLRLGNDPKDVIQVKGHHFFKVSCI